MWTFCLYFTEFHSNMTAAEIPIWVNGLQRWISGIGRKTTCDDVIKVLLRTEGLAVDEKNIKCYAIIERWRKVERPLEGKSKILKVWKTWGDEQDDVKLTLRKISPTTPKEVKTLKRKHQSKFWPQTRSKLETVHPKKLSQEDARFTENMERLMKLILAQGETIQTQLKRLQDRDDQINQIEHKMHRMRVEKLGSNYLVDTYLGDEEDESEERDDSGITTEAGSGNGSEPGSAGVEPGCSKDSGSSTSSCKMGYKNVSQGNVVSDDTADTDLCTKESPEDLQMLQDLKSEIEIWESIYKLNQKLEKEEECLVKLHVKFRRLSHEHCQMLKKSEMVAEGESNQEVFKELEQAKAELEQIVALTARRSMEIEHSSFMLMEADKLLDGRYRYMRKLQGELEATDHETERLKYELDFITRLPPEAFMLKCNAEENVTKSTSSQSKCCEKETNDTDSNSDTGLSSLHSSSEEGVYVLDTLV